ncbi:MAG: acyltransferase family protein [Chloroflexi bacterium]|nr:acyltransferase family protein [Chloroflexota bacterium]
MQRTLWLDRLRLLATFTVVLLHVSAASVMGSRDLQWWIGNIADSFTRWAVPTFVMITGALLLRTPLEVSPTTFYRRRLGRILLPLIFWSVLYTLWSTVRSGAYDWQTLLIRFLTGNPYFHMWYIFMLVGLYLVAPFVNYAVIHIPRAWLRTAIIVSFALAIIETYASRTAQRRHLLLQFPALCRLFPGGALFRHR